MELQGEVTGQGHHQAALEEVGERVLKVFRELAGYWGHRQGHLAKVVQVLQCRILRQIRPSHNGCCCEEGAPQVLQGSLPTMCTEGEGVLPQHSSHIVEGSDVDPQVVHPCAVIRVVFGGPILRITQVDGNVNGPLIGHHVEAADMGQKVIEDRVRARLQGDLPQRHEDVAQQLGQVRHLGVFLCHVVEPWELHSELVVGRGHTMNVLPRCKVVPIILGESADCQAILREEVRVVLQFLEGGLDDLGSIPTGHAVVCAQEQLVELPIPFRVVPGVEVIKGLHGGWVGLGCELADVDAVDIADAQLLQQPSHCVGLVVHDHHDVLCGLRCLLQEEVLELLGSHPRL
mmetsp:Transcript_18138/g.32247  ORF Transcript_18138/g.32247 Transcript_18138/m.32247 type:complete len:345 (+) Transcript_18138:579-1613(+)